VTKPIALEAQSAAAPLVLTSRRREHMFYTTMAVVIALTVVAGFARTYYLRPWFVESPLRPLVHLHGLVFTSWIVLFLAQTSLIATDRTWVHRRLGIAGAVIAVLMVLLGTTTAIVGAGHGSGPPGVPPLVFLAIPLADMVVFATLVGTGFRLRRRPDVHKRLMLLATISILAAPIARLPLVMKAGPLAFFGLADLFLVACVVYDVATLGRVHRATVLGGLFILASQPLRLMVSGTDAWMIFARWVTGS
jgi:FtsH-binding integral membrane protein